MLKALAGIELFQGMGLNALRSLLAELSWVSLTAGEQLIRQDEDGDALYVLLNGRLRVTFTRDDGREYGIVEIGRGECVGEMSVLTGQLTTANVYAIRDSNLIRLSKAAFHRFKEQHPAVLEQINRLIVRRIKN